MAYAARVIQILIASPGDVREEREIISEVIYEWNYINSRDRSIVLLPIRWETHASPDMGSRPQNVINRQIVDHCDMAVAVFWTRLGTPTDEAESGTAEEIERIGKSGKPVMVYFSHAPGPMHTLDLDEYRRLQEFQKQTYPKGLIETYCATAEFRDKLRRQLAIQIGYIIAADSQERSESEEGNRISLTFAEQGPMDIFPTLLSPPNVLEITRMTCTDKGSIPDYKKFETEPTATGGDTRFSYAISPNYEFYRHVVAFAERASACRELRLVISNDSDRSLRDIHLDISVRSNTDHFAINPLQLAFPKSRRESYPLDAQQAFREHIPVEQVAVQYVSENKWRIEADIPVIQAHRTAYLNGVFSVLATVDSTVVFDATVYSSDTVPFALNAELKIRVQRQEMPYREILKEMAPGHIEE